MRHRIVYLVLRSVHALSRAFYRYQWHWVGDVPAGNPWLDFRLVAILNHTSLFEFLLAGGVPKRFLKRMARHGVVPIASKTIRRPLVGRFWQMIAGNVVSISRERDETWQQVLKSIDPDSMVVILPEGRMKRADGLDSHGKPLVIRGGIAEIIETIPEGHMLLAYSEGLHHIQVPGQRFPHFGKLIRMRLEALDIAAYRARLREQSGDDPKAFRQAVIDDLTRRRDRYCADGFDEPSAILDPVSPDSSSARSSSAK